MKRDLFQARTSTLFKFTVVSYIYEISGHIQ